jgi:hypothetical protein
MASENPAPFKMIFLIKKRPDMTETQFIEHWSGVHAHTAMQFPVFPNKVRKYSQV